MTITPFREAVFFTMHEETGGDPNGGYNDRPHDRGGATKWGVSERAYPGIDIETLTEAQATEIYEEIWLDADCDKLPGPVAVAHFDCAFNSGSPQAAKILQRALGTAADGVIGERTLEALKMKMGGRGANGVAVLAVVERGRFIGNLVDEPEKPRERMNLHNVEGWIVRLIRLTALVARM